LKEKRREKVEEMKKKREDINRKRRKVNQKADLELLTKRDFKKNKEEFEMNFEDNRFGRMFGDRDFAVDPTNPLYDKNKMKSVISEKNKRKKMKYGNL